MATGTRNLLYDKSVLKSFTPKVPVIVVGNLIAGGTGKTPVIGWLAWKLSEKYNVAILSRGYGRNTRGFQFLDMHATPSSVGDEPMELHFLLPDIPIAVDSNRKRGIQKLSSGEYGKIDVILMDDGFQHRRIKPGFSIILDDFNRPMKQEKMLPAGLRRESLSSLKRADLVIETKKPTDTEIGHTDAPIILITGIANPKPLAEAVAKSGSICRHLKYPDHHRYTSAEAATIRDIYYYYLRESQLRPDSIPPVILTTGKDYVKLSRMDELSGLPLQIIPYAPPVEAEQQQEILQKIYQYVDKAHGNS